jgi:hypothetical protein
MVWLQASIFKIKPITLTSLRSWFLIPINLHWLIFSDIFTGRIFSSKASTLSLLCLLFQTGNSFCNIKRVLLTSKTSVDNVVCFNHCCLKNIIEITCLQIIIFNVSFRVTFTTLIDDRTICTGSICSMCHCSKLNMLISFMSKLFITYYLNMLHIMSSNRKYACNSLNVVS